MPQKQILSQVLAEAGKLYNETVRMQSEGAGGITSELEASFTQFASQMSTILMNLQTSLSASSNELAQLNSETEIRYLHICAPVPQTGTGVEQPAIPSTNTIPTMFIKGKGRIHCLALTGSYVPYLIKLTMRQYNEFYVEQRSQEMYVVPVCSNNVYPQSAAKTWPHPFWNVFYWIEPFPSGNIYMPAGVSGIFPYFEHFGYNENSQYTNFYVTSTPQGKYWCTGIVWESECDHGDAVGSQLE